MVNSFRGLPFFLHSLFVFSAQNKAQSYKLFPIRFPYLCLSDRYMQSGEASGHYFHQDMHVARRIFEKNPERHVDVGSRIDGFVAHVAIFREVEVFDVRSLDSQIPNITFRQIDLMGEMPSEFLASCDSLSCLHALEHFGLGRYGDPVNRDGFYAGFNNLTKVIKPGGTFYFSVPIGPGRVEFNAHRVFPVRFLLELFTQNFTVEDFCYVDDSGDLHKHVKLAEQGIDTNFGCQYGCGIFELMKK